MTKPHQQAVPSSPLLERLAFGICLGMIALRVLLNEAPPLPASSASVQIHDMVSSLAVSSTLILLTGCWILWQLWTGSAYRRTGLETGLGIFLIGAVCATVLASDKRMAVNTTIVFTAPILMSILLVQILNRPSRIRIVLTLLAILGLLSTLRCISQYLYENQVVIEQYQADPQHIFEDMGLEDTPLNRFLFEHRLYTRGLRSFFLTRNSAASFSLITLFAAMGLFIQTTHHHRSGKGRVFMILAACLAAGIAAGLFLTKSKGALIGLATGLAALIVWHYGKGFICKHKRLIFMGMLLCLVLLTWALVSYGMEHGRLPGGQSMLVRWQYWHATARLIQVHPVFGIGPGQFSYYYNYVKPPEALESVADPHNLLLSMLIQYGPLGLLGLVVMFFGYHRKINHPLSTVLFCGVLAVLVANLTDFALWEPPVFTAFWTLVACSIACGAEEEVGKPSQPSIAVKYLITIVVLMASVLLIQWGYIPVVSATHKTREAYKCMQEGYYPWAHDLLEQATAGDALCPTAPALNGRLYVQRYQDGIPKNPAWLDKAASCFQQAIQRNRAYYKDYQRLAEVYDLRNDMINADHMYHLAVERYPGSGQLWLALGRLAEKRGDNEGAVTYYTQAVAIEDAFQRQFRIMYPDRDTIIHRMGDEDYRLAQERIEVLSGDH
jgi:hypothetical protein